jgi:hypothetical protein
MSCSMAGAVAVMAKLWHGSADRGIGVVGFVQ